jgi:hypothetical protein
MYRGAFAVRRDGEQLQLSVPGASLYAAHSTHGSSAKMLVAHLEALAGERAADGPLPIWLREDASRQTAIASFEMLAFKKVE